MQKKISGLQYWNIMKNFIKETGLVRQHIDSYNDFIDAGLQSIIDEVNEIPIEVEENPFTIKLGKIEIGTPRVMEVDGSERRVYPAEARIRNLTYAAPLNLEMTPVIGEKEGAEDARQEAVCRKPDLLCDQRRAGRTVRQLRRGC